ncbi:acyltransferase-like protein, chloroplastic isoform X1, partial [Tanacetum coccineum]
MVIISVPLSPVLTLNGNRRLRSRVIIRGVGSEDSVTVSQESVRISGASSVKRKGTKSGEDVNEELKPMWDDGYGTQTMRDCAKTMEMVLGKSDGGPPRWFCPVACGKPLKGSPVLLYLPGVDGTGAGLAVHEKALGKVFRVQCLHIPTWDRTPLEGYHLLLQLSSTVSYIAESLIQIVEETLMIEHGLSPKKPIYLLGDSFGGALALSVAARNPTLDLILILANPATSYGMSLVHPLVAIGKALPEEFHVLAPYAISPLLGNYVKLVKDGTNDESLLKPLWQVPGNLRKDVPLLSMMAKILPKDTLYWRLELIESAAAYANSRLHAITAQVLVLA